MKFKVITICFLIFLNIYIIKTARSSSTSKKITSTSISTTATTITNKSSKINTISQLPRPTTLKPIEIAANAAFVEVPNDKNLKKNNAAKHVVTSNENENIKALESFQFGLKKIVSTTKITDIDKLDSNPAMISRKRKTPTKPTIMSKNLSLSTDKKKQVPKKYISPTIEVPQPQTNSIGPLKVSFPKSLKLAPPSDTLVCPKETQAKFNLFALACKTHSDCTLWNKENRCCTLFRSRNCHRGVPKPLEEQPHKPILGLLPHKCPKNPLGELWWDLKTCKTDEDCWPRVCCPDGRNKYCRSTSPEYESIPFQIGRPLAYFSEYLECTPPPPPIFDVHPKACNSTFDCFPNVCCQEDGKKNCRPPKKSVLTFMANFLNTGLLKRLTNNLVIR